MDSAVIYLASMLSAWKWVQSPMLGPSSVGYQTIIVLGENWWCNSAVSGFLISFHSFFLIPYQLEPMSCPRILISKLPATLPTSTPRPSFAFHAVKILIFPPTESLQAVEFAFTLLSDLGLKLISDDFSYTGAHHIKFLSPDYASWNKTPRNQWRCTQQVTLESKDLETRVVNVDWVSRS